MLHIGGQAAVRTAFPDAQMWLRETRPHEWSGAHGFEGDGTFSPATVRLDAARRVEAARESLRNVYRTVWNLAERRAVLRAVPHLMMWSEADISAGFAQPSSVAGRRVPPQLVRLAREVCVARRSPGAPRAAQRAPFTNPLAFPPSLPLAPTCSFVSFGLRSYHEYQRQLWDTVDVAANGRLRLVEERRRHAPIRLSQAVATATMEIRTDPEMLRDYRGTNPADAMAGSGAAAAKARSGSSAHKSAELNADAVTTTDVVDALAVGAGVPEVMRALAASDRWEDDLEEYHVHTVGEAALFFVDIRSASIQASGAPVPGGGPLLSERQWYGLSSTMLAPGLKALVLVSEIPCVRLVVCVAAPRAAVEVRPHSHKYTTHSHLPRLHHSFVQQSPRDAQLANALDPLASLSTQPASGGAQFRSTCLWSLDALALGASLPTSTPISLHVEILHACRLCVQRSSPPASCTVARGLRLAFPCTPILSLSLSHTHTHTLSLSLPAPCRAHADDGLRMEDGLRRGGGRRPEGTAAHV